MAYAATGYQALAVMGTPDGSAGSRRQVHTYITNDTPAQVETADYLISIYQRLKVGDLILASIDIDGTPRHRTYLVLTSAVGGVTIKREDDDDSAGQGTRAVVATADGLTTGLILDTDSHVTITNGGNVAYWSTLPACSAATIGREIQILCSAAASELRTPAAGTDTINNVNCGAGAAELLMTAGNTYIARQALATGWVVIGHTHLGAVQAAVVPD